MAVWRYGDVIPSQCDALGFAEQRDEDEHSEHCSLNENGKEQRAAANAAFAMVLLRVAFNKARS